MPAAHDLTPEEDLTKETILNKALSRIVMLRNHAIREMNDVTNQIRQMIPETPIPDARDRRSLLPFVGDLSSTLFGTATNKQVKVIARHMKVLKEQTGMLKHVFQEQSENFISHMHTEDRRMTNAIKAIQSNHEIIDKFTITVQAKFGHLVVAVGLIVEHLTEQVELSAELERRVENLNIGVKDLIHGRLTPLLIPPSIMRDTVSNISQALNTRHPMFQLLKTNLKQIYRSTKRILSRHRNGLYVTLQFPLIAITASPFTVYKVTSIPVPINSSSNHATQLLDLHPYFAISRDRNHFLELSEVQISQCKGYGQKHCPSLFAQRDTSENSCILAIFLQNSQDIKQLCNFRTIQNAIKPSMEPLDAERILMTKISSLDVHCQTYQKTIRGCTQCIMHVPCQCSLVKSSFFIPPRLTGCSNTNSFKKIYAVNLALMQEFFSQRSLANITGETDFNSQIAIKIPSFELYQHRFQELIAADTEQHLNLRKVAEATKKNNKVFQTLAEPFLDEGMEVSGLFSMSWTNIIIYITLGLVVVSLALNIYILIRLKVLAAGLLLLQNVHTVRSDNSFIYTTTHLPVLKDDTPSWSYIEYWDDYATMTIVAIAVITSISLYIRKKYSLNNNKTVLQIELTNGSTCISIPAVTLPLCPRHWIFNASRYVSDLKVTGYIRPTLHVDWHDFTMTNTLTNHSLKPEKEIRLNLLTGYLIRNILKADYSTFLYLSHYGYAFQFGIEARDRDEMTRSAETNDC